jgi:hypothetical protein
MTRLRAFLVSISTLGLFGILLMEGLRGESTAWFWMGILVAAGLWFVWTFSHDSAGVPTETKPRSAHEIALDARRAERRAEDEARAAKRLYPQDRP